MATPPLGRTTSAFRPRLAAYAEADALVFPVEAQINAWAPLSIAFATASAIPRSLNDPLGLRPSYLKNRRLNPSDGPMRREVTSGVEPSPRLTRGVAGVTGNQAAYRSMIPGVMHPQPRWPLATRP